MRLAFLILLLIPMFLVAHAYATPIIDVPLNGTLANYGSVPNIPSSAINPTYGNLGLNYPTGQFLTLAYAPITTTSIKTVSDTSLQNFTISKLVNGTQIWKKPALILSNKTSNFDSLLKTDTASNVGIITTLNMSGINIDSTIDSSTIDILAFGNAAKICTLQLADDYLNSMILSNSFSCFGQTHVVLNKAGLDSLKNNMRIFSISNMKVVDSDNNTIKFTSSNAQIKYHPQTYYAKVENGKVTNVIVADSSFVNSLSGTWIETKPDHSIRGNYAGIGFTYDSVKDQFIAPQPYPSWSLNSTGQWNAPTKYPSDGLPYFWNEQTKTWVKAI